MHSNMVQVYPIPSGSHWIIEAEKFCEGKKTYKIMVKERHKFGFYCFLFKVIELSIFIYWRES